MLIFDRTLDSSLFFLFKSHCNRYAPLSFLSVCPIQGLHRPDGEPHPEHGPARQRCPGWDPRPVPLLHEDPRDQAVASATSLHSSGPTPPNPDMRSREDEGFGVRGYLNFTPKILPFPKSRSPGLVVVDHDGRCMSDQESVAFEDRKSQWESVYFHCRAFLLLSGIFCFFAWETWTGFGESFGKRLFRIEALMKGRGGEMKDSS